MLLSGGSGWATFTTPTIPQYTLRVDVRNIPKNKSVYLNVTDTSTGAHATGSPLTVTDTSSTKSLTLPFGVYTVTVVSGTTTKTTSASLTGDPSKIVYVTFIL